MLISVADLIESGIECMLTQFSLRKAAAAVAEGGVRFELKVPGLCSTCPPITSSLSPLVDGGGAEDTAMAGVTVAGGA